ncbi:MAG TPA: sugar ABC transporter permease [Chloroflexota bacterium]
MRLTHARREAIEGYVCLAPWALGFVIWIAGPMLYSLYLSLTDSDVLSPPKFVGLKNYERAFFGDDLFWSSLGRTFYYAILVVPAGVAGSLLAALLLNQRLKATNLYRTLYFLPHLTPTVAAALLWVWVLQPEFGLVNYLLDRLGIQGPAWFGSKEWAIPALAMIALWNGIGGNRMMIFLAGLQGVPPELVDAAEVDGASAWQRFRHVTLPMISPTMFFNLVLGVIAALQVFTTALIATRGGPANATWFYALHIYTNAFQYFSMGYASALAWIFFVVVFVFTAIQMRASSRWVYYAGGEQ